MDLILKLNELIEFERSPREFMRHFFRLYDTLHTQGQNASPVEQKEE